MISIYVVYLKLDKVWILLVVITKIPPINKITTI